MLLIALNWTADFVCAPLQTGWTRSCLAVAIFFSLKGHFVKPKVGWSLETNTLHIIMELWPSTLYTSELTGCKSIVSAAVSAASYRRTGADQRPRQRQSTAIWFAATAEDCRSAIPGFVQRFAASIFASIQH
jgi:hypothetical protein